MAEQGIRKWLITFILVFSMLMKLIDTAVVNLSLPHIMDSLGAGFDEIGRVVAAYSVAIAMALPISGWLSHRTGRITYYLGSTTLFTVFPLFCGHAHTMQEPIAFRFPQGLAGGGMATTARRLVYHNTMLIEHPTPHSLVFAQRWKAMTAGFQIQGPGLMQARQTALAALQRITVCCCPIWMCSGSWESSFYARCRWQRPRNTGLKIETNHSSPGTNRT